MKTDKPKLCGCGNVAVKLTSDGYACQRCLDIESRFYADETAGVTNLPKTDDYGLEPA